MSGREHWDKVYTKKGADHVSWFRPHLDRSLAYLDAGKLGRATGLIDVGGGASTFVDELLDRGYVNVTVLDLSETALETARARLAARVARSLDLC